MREHCEKVGRERGPEVLLDGLSPIGKQFDAETLLERLGKLRQLGVVGAAVHIQADTRAEWCDHAARFGADVLAKLPKVRT